MIQSFKQVQNYDNSKPEFQNTNVNLFYGLNSKDMPVIFQLRRTMFEAQRNKLSQKLTQGDFQSFIRFRVYFQILSKNIQY
jgi:hypothetical protein